MVYGVTPECSKCKGNESSIWHKGEDEVLCQECFKLNAAKASESNSDKEDEKETVPMEVESEEKLNQDGITNKNIKEEEEIDKEKESSKTADKKEAKKKPRKGRQGGKGVSLRAKEGDTSSKKATKAPVAVSTPVTSEYIFYQGTYYQVGDVVSVIDVEGGTYYAQIRGLLQDQYCEKSAVITWLLPTKKSPSPEEKFDPTTYIIGPEEDVPRKLEFLRFVCHAPSDYFKDRTSPYATVCYKPQSCYVWSKMAPVIKSIENAKELIAK